MMLDPMPSLGLGTPSTCEDCQTITLQNLHQTSSKAARYVRSGTLDFIPSLTPSCAVCNFVVNVAKEAQEHKSDRESMTLASGIRYLRLIPIPILIRIMPQELCTALGSTFEGDKGVAPSVRKFFCGQYQEVGRANWEEGLEG
jgi:hypothetical protein